MGASPDGDHPKSVSREQREKHNQYHRDWRMGIKCKGEHAGLYVKRRVRKMHIAPKIIAHGAAGLRDWAHEF